MSSKTKTTNDSQAQLNDELRSYAERSPVSIVRPSMEDAIAAIKPHFPELIQANKDVQQLLDEVGLPVITDISRNYKPKRISWSIVTTQKSAEEQVSKYKKAAYQSIREALEINYHWVFLVPSGDLFMPTSEPLVEGIGDFREDGMPNCWILDRF